MNPLPLKKLMLFYKIKVVKIFVEMLGKEFMQEIQSY